MKAPAVITVDFETDAIATRPKYPPVPCSVSIQWPKDKKPKFYAWGHPTGNNCDITTARRALMAAWSSGVPLLFQNAKFDIDVAFVHMDLPVPPWELIHDTMYLIFLHDPHAFTYSLKPAAERILGMPPTEQQDVRNWLIEQGVVAKNDKRWGACISKAPGDLVGKYADGDVLRTRKLFQKLYPSIVERGMKEAYDRERELMPILLANEQQGIRADLARLRADVAIYRASMDAAEKWLRKRLKAPTLNLDADADVGEALNSTGLVTEWVLTKTGKRSTAKENMTPAMFKDKKVYQVLGYRNRLQTALSTFMLPWLETAEESRGVIFTNWNQVRQNRDGGSSNAGARTGRMSSSPNFQNIPKNFEDKGDGYTHPAFLSSLSELPLLRRYILPDHDQTFVHRDYSQQELRILAHFEGGGLCKAYQEDPTLDMHEYIRSAIQETTGQELDRGKVKTINFGILYGMGLGKLAERLGVSYEEAKTLKHAHRRGAPEVAELEKQIKTFGKEQQPISTWGGRDYLAEPPKRDEHGNVLQTFEYKLLNYLIQGSAADCSKQAVINYHKVKKHGRFLVTVHDEINISAPTGAVKSEMKLLREAMADVKFDVPMLSDGKVGPNWGELTKYKE